MPVEHIAMRQCKEERKPQGLAQVGSYKARADGGGCAGQSMMRAATAEFLLSLFCSHQFSIGRRSKAN